MMSDEMLKKMPHAMLQGANEMMKKTPGQRRHDGRCVGLLALPDCLVRPCWAAPCCAIR